MRALFVFALLLTTAARADDDASRRLLLMVQYVASDYRGAVSQDGQVANAFEYDENVQTVKDAAALYARLRPGGPSSAALQTLVDLVSHGSAPTPVETTARELALRLRQELGIAPAPLFWPDLSIAQRVYTEQCAGCHGTTGRGDGPAAATLQPKPPDFTQPAWADARTPLQLASTIELGIPGTEMKAFGAIDGLTRWALAFFLLTFREPAHRGTERPWLGVTELSTTPNTLLAERLAVSMGVTPERALAMADAARRDPAPTLTVPQAMARLGEAARGASALFGKKRAADASDLLVACYYDAVEPAEEELIRTHPEALPAMEGAVNALRDALRSGAGVDAAAEALVTESARVAALYGVEAPRPTPRAGHSSHLAIVTGVTVLAVVLFWFQRRTKR